MNELFIYLVGERAVGAEFVSCGGAIGEVYGRGGGSEGLGLLGDRR